MEIEKESYSELGQWAETGVQPSLHWRTRPALAQATSSHDLAFVAQNDVRPAHGHDACTQPRLGIGGWLANEHELPTSFQGSQCISRATF
jgi:hypothetical protein